MAKIKHGLKELASTDPLKLGKNEDLFVGRPFSLDYNQANILICDDDKMRVKGIPQGTFLLAFYDNEETVEEAILLRALNPTKLPTDTAMVGSMIEYYKENLPTTGKDSKLDDFTRFEFSFSGMQCSVLGTFYRNAEGKVEFGADLENFYSPHHYSVYKLSKDVLFYVVNQRDSDVPAGGDIEFPIGHVRYSSSQRFQEGEEKAKVFINPTDLLGKRTALFGMTRTGKSNTVKKAIEASTEISLKAKYKLDKQDEESGENNLLNFVTGAPKYPVGQIIFDINGEYANANLQDKGTAIFEMYKENTIRYSILEKNDPSFKIMKVNFYKDVVTGVSYISSALEDDDGDYVTSFRVIDFTSPPLPASPSDANAWRIYNIKKAIYFCCLNKAGFTPPTNFKIKFKADATIRNLVNDKLGYELDIEDITLEEAEAWWKCAWENRQDKVFQDLKKKNRKDWFSEEMAALMVFLTKKREAGQSVNGYEKFKSVLKMHTNTTSSSFEKDILTHLRKGGIVIIDLSQGDPALQKIFSERICKKVFNDSMGRFTESKPNNFIQFYFEEAHNLFPKKEDKDLSQIYNRIAKEGAKLNLGMIYATQEVSSISSNILKNTQNWFIAHLNNDDEIKELKKYYDFSDFTDALIRFSAKNDKGFVRMKTYSNPFVVPVQIDQFLAPTKK